MGRPRLGSGNCLPGWGRQARRWHRWTSGVRRWQIVEM
uniref:Uncharacterized protein n=1 Tax=Arundo donax TaxID=35708 RepID=A0A0A8Y869_ARUDO